jgi:glutathione S-transferase
MSPETQDQQLTLFHCPQSRSITARWMLEELGLAYRLEIVDVRAGAGQAPAFLEINPMGKVPALMHGEAVVTESGAICQYLADRFAPGTLAPPIDDPRRGPFLRWLFFAPVADSALVERLLERTPPPRASVGWGDYTSVIQTLRAALANGPWVLGDMFTAADVALGGQIVWGRMMGLIPDDEPFRSYVTRAMARPACKKVWNDSEPTAGA